MPTSDLPEATDRLTGLAAALAWGAWSELGVSGWTRTHRQWAVDLEPLILLTALLGDEDPRLRDEATDWCIRNTRYVSRVRLKNLLRREAMTTHEAFGEFAATVSRHSGTMWPGATTPRRYTPTGRSTPPALDRPSAAWLRLRAMFGVGARAEILRVMLSKNDAPLSVAAIAEATSFTKRNVADECEGLASAGVLGVRVHGNRFDYDLARPDALRMFVGDLPSIRPPWVALLSVTGQLLHLERRASQGSRKTLGIEVNKTLRALEKDVRDLGLQPVAPTPDLDELWPTTQARAAAWLRTWAEGEWPGPGQRKPR